MERLRNNPEIQQEQEPPQAITPEQVSEMQKEQTPPEVVETINRLLAENARKGHATIRSAVIVEALVEKGLNRGDVLTKPWLYFEDTYREAGWNVRYKSPKGEQDFDPYYEFKAKRQQGLGHAAANETIDYSWPE